MNEIDFVGPGIVTPPERAETSTRTARKKMKSHEVVAKRQMMMTMTQAKCRSDAK